MPIYEGSKDFFDRKPISFSTFFSKIFNSDEKKQIQSQVVLQGGAGTNV